MAQPDQVLYAESQHCWGGGGREVRTAEREGEDWDEGRGREAEMQTEPDQVLYAESQYCWG